MCSSHTPLALETLYTDHHGWLRGWLRKRLGNACDAADLAHDTYLRIITSGRVPPPDQSRRHLTRIANGLVVDLYRRRQIELAYLEAIALLPAAHVPSEETRAITLEALVEIDALLHCVSAKARSALLLCKLEGMSYRDIPERLHVSVSSVEKYIATALQVCASALHAPAP
ncbi:sigma-70 family RNA polymerase sigma factor [Massilia pseudoviolaceinigra]|uniref:sigma-70 family RNA polymerase sigma factor n=1 Tax=Massilia pseudoviolaceinigra TaxID=3057165 RepID=UPI002796617A|nr:sigma-70 family RNA polymerase sigma factor [Massilia sp. CCM 9206]MDQ1920132.1 sigma-70 family RNA polymerase sigma factor [Massilia sp. CCM 9206]